MRETDYDHLVLPHPAAVILRGQAEMRAAAVESRALDETALEGEEPYFWSAEISSNRLDSHFTRMDVSSLKNYASDAQGGVSFLYSHDNSEIIGRSTAGQFVGAQGNAVARVLADFYAVPGLMLGTVPSDQVIRAIKLGIIRDVSIGFFGGELECSICGRDIFRDWECRHYPGFKYEVEGEGKVKEETCTATVKDARLAEVSGVYKGSTPGAVIVKAERDAEDGRLKPEARQLIEQRYRIHLPGRAVTVPGTGGGRMADEKREAKEPENKTESPGAADESQNQPITPPEAPPPSDDAPPVDGEAESERRVVSFARTQFAAANFKADEAPPSMRALVDLALDGKRYRDDLIAEAHKAGVRAHGDKYERDTFDRIMRRASIEEIRALASGWGAKFDLVFGGGRQTSDEAEIPDESGKSEGAATVPPAYTAAYGAS